MERIAKCESGAKQVDSKGVLIKHVNKDGSVDIGRWMINDKRHEARPLHSDSTFIRRKETPATPIISTRRKAQSCGFIPNLVGSNNMPFEIERTQTLLLKEHAPDVEVSTIRGEYILKVGGLEIERWEAGDRTTAKIIQGWIQRKLSQGYQSREYVSPENLHN